MKKIMFLIIVLLTTFGIQGCSKDNDNKIVIAEVTHSPFYAPQYVALSEGIFEKYNLDVEIILTSGADKVMSSLLSGDAQIGLMGPEASIYIYNQDSKDYAITFAQLTNCDGSFLLGREENNDFKLTDLSNSSILGGREGGMPLMVLEYILKSNNIPMARNDQSANVNVRSDIQFAAMAGAFVSGEGDYVSLFEPTASNLVKNNEGYILASLGTLSGEIPYTCYSSKKSYIEKNEDKIERFTKAIYEAQQWVYSHTSREIAESIKDFFKEETIDDLETYVESYYKIEAWAKNPLITKESYNKLSDIIILAGEIKERAPYDILIDQSYALEALK